MRRLSILVMFALLSAAAWAIAPHQLSLPEVLERPCRVAVCRITCTHAGATDHASVLALGFEVESYAWGRGPLGPRQGVYSAAYPYRMPDGKVEAPIHTGSGLEHELHMGDRVLLILGNEPASIETVWRAEPLSLRDRILAMLRQRRQP